MSVRTRLAGAVAVVATASAALTLLPGTANAATPPAPASPLHLSVGHVQSGRLLPGGAARSFTVAVSNPSGHAESFDAELAGLPHGALPIYDNDARVTVRPVHAPATDALVGSQDGSLLGAFYPKGGHWGSTFEIPAHTTYTWKVSVEATKSFPINDDRLKMNVIIGAEHNRVELFRSVDFRVGYGHTGGPILESLTGGSRISKDHPLYLDYKLVNRTGARLTTGKHFSWIGQGGVLRNQLSGVSLAFDVWRDGRWVEVGRYGAALPSPAHVANGASFTDRIRVRVIGWDAKAATGRISIMVGYDGINGGAVYKVVEASRA